MCVHDKKEREKMSVGKMGERSEKTDVNDAGEGRALRAGCG